MGRLAASMGWTPPPHSPDPRIGVAAGTVSTFFFQEKLSTGPPIIAEGAKLGLERGMDGTHEDFLVDIPEEEIPHGA